MAVTIHPPINQPDAVDRVEARGVAWAVGTMGTLDISDQGGTIVATFASQSWGWVERS